MQKLILQCGSSIQLRVDSVVVLLVFTLSVSSSIARGSAPAILALRHRWPRYLLHDRDAAFTDVLAR